VTLYTKNSVDGHTKEMLLLLPLTARVF